MSTDKKIIAVKCFCSVLTGSSFGSESNPGITTTINNKTYRLGQIFISGVSNPEVKKYSGDIIYIDNRPAITRSQSQKEFLKAILRF